MEPLVFAETRTFAPFFLILVGGAVAIGAWRLLWPWPLRPRKVVGFVLLLWAAAASAWLSANQRVVVLDREERVVREGRSFLRMAKFDERPFAAFTRVVVERSGRGFAFRLDGPQGGPFLGTSADVFQAEQLARGVAAAGGWQAQRRGYRLGTPVAGSVQSVRTREGANVVGVDLQATTQVVPAPGEENL
ncbi:MAG TPA: hypothetical protein VJM11_19105 [Nevskiaceae bacterium]|nr:hypothetical protein [Nevskiaceae bacterium]